MAVKTIGRWIGDLLFPPERSCICCKGDLGTPLNRLGLCADCVKALEHLAREQEEREMLEAIPPAEGLRYVHCAFPYRDEARALVLRLKFGSLRAAAKPLSLAMSVLSAEDEDLIVPVPTTAARRRERGFNQAEVLAGQLARSYGMKMKAGLLFRMDDGEAQSTLSGAERRRHLEGCMRASPEAAGHRILLVDDVYTTGATAREAARALGAAGALGVGMLCACCAWYPEEGNREEPQASGESNAILRENA
ncbi:MAG: ComF family protein [Clostridia bacterium]|nr:ComF family protein [Clostridia bacterium]